MTKARLRLSDTPELFLDGVVGEDIRADRTRELLEQVTGDFTVHLNSPGGSVFEGLAVYNALKEHPGRVHVIIDGLAASMASAIAMAGDSIEMYPASMMMIHNPWTLSIGDAEQLRSDAQMLDRIRENLLGIYQARTGKRPDELRSMLDAETWLTADDAVASGFATRIRDGSAEQALARVPLGVLNALPTTIGQAFAMAGNTEVQTMNEPQMTASDVKEIYRIARAAGMDIDFAENLTQEVSSVPEAKDKILERMESQQVRISSHVRVGDDQTFDNPEFGRKMMVEALASRISGRAPQNEAARAFMSYRVADFAKECLEYRGNSTKTMGVSRMVEAALHSTSDFPELLTATGERIMRAAYEAAPAGVKNIAAQTTAPDFRSIHHLQIGEAPNLEKVTEGGEFTYGSTAEAKESYKLETFGRMFGVSRQALVNDDLDAFGQMASWLGTAAQQFEAQQLVSLLTSNPDMHDGDPLFHTSHGNVAGSGSALSVDALGSARRAMRLQKGINSDYPIDVQPRFLLVPASLETDAEKLLADLMASEVSEVNPFAGRLQLVVDPRLDADSETRWYVMGDPTVIPTLQYAYLQEAPGPQIFMREGFERDGVEWKVRLDFGSGALDWRGAYRNDGQ